MLGSESWDDVIRDLVIQHGIVSVTDGSGRILLVSDAFCELSGFARGELLGKTHNVVRSEVHTDGYHAQMWSTVNGGEVWRGEFCNRRKGGETYWVSARIVPTRDVAGELRLISFQTDITDYKRMQQALAASEERLQFFMQNMDESAVVIADGRIIDVSDEGSAMFRLPREQIVGANPLGFVTPEAREEIAALMARGFSEPYEATMLRADGSTFPGVLRGRSRMLDGKPVRFTTVIDVSPQKAAQEELRAAKAEAERANQAKSDFLSAMSHELRTPLNAVLGFAQMLEFPAMGSLSPRQLECVTEIRRGGHHLLELINDILELSKIEAGHVPISIEPVAVPEVVEGCLALTRPIANKRGVSLKFSLEEDVEAEADGSTGLIPAPRGPAVFADRTRLKQVLTNLIANAIKYNRTNGSVTVAIHNSEAGRVRVSVQDTGIGIHPDKLSELFQPFNRLGAESTEVEGTGIGLALTKRLMSVMDGEIGVTSKWGEGSTFWIELQGCNLPTEATVSVRSAVLSSQTPRIEATLLYVEDNPANIRLMEYIAGSVPGLELLTAHTGHLGIEIAQVHSVDVVVLDMQLPDLSGIQVMQQLRELPGYSDVPIMALSASATEASVRRGLNAGFFRYMFKPIKISEFIAAVSEAMAQRRPSKDDA